MVKSRVPAERAGRPRHSHRTAADSLVSDDLVERIKRAAGGEGQVSSYVATALADYQEREDLEQVLAPWRSETPIADDVRRQVAAGLDEVGLAASSTRRSRQAG